MPLLPKRLKKIWAFIFSEDCVTNTLHSLKAMLTSAEEPLGQEEPEGKNSFSTAAPTPAYIIQKSWSIWGEDSWRSTDRQHQAISQKTGVQILLQTSLTLLLFEHLPWTKITQVLMSLQKGRKEGRNITGIVNAKWVFCW